MGIEDCKKKIRNLQIKWSECKKHKKKFIILCMSCFLEAEKKHVQS